MYFYIKNTKKTLYLGVFFVFLLLFDFLTKHFFYNKSLYCNKNISLNIELDNYVFWIIWLIINIFFIWQLLFKSKMLYLKQISIILVLSGSFSNIFDRIYFGCVRDFILFFSENFFYFNFADLFIFIGVFIFFINFPKS